MAKEKKTKKKNTKKAAKKRAIKRKAASVKNTKKKKASKSTKKKITKAKKKITKKPITKKNKRIKNLSKSAIENHIKKAFIRQPKQPSESKEKKQKVDLIKIDIIDIEQKPSNKIVIFDTNFLLIPEQFKIDIFTQTKKLLNARKVDFMIFDKTIYELQKIAALNSKSGTSAKVALLLINKNKVNIITSNDDEYVDDMLVNYENYLIDYKGDIIIGTQDKELKDRLKEKGIKTLIMANKSKLTIK